jgi:hypothetical protein
MLVWSRSELGSLSECWYFVILRCDPSKRVPWRDSVFGTRAIGVDKLLLGQPGCCCHRIGGDQKDLLHRTGTDVLALQPRICRVLDLECFGGLAPAGLDSSGDDAADMGAVLDDVVQQIVKTVRAAVLSFDTPKLQGG